MISIIYPIYNEEKTLSVNSVVFRELSDYAELTFVDGGSTDRSVDFAHRYGKVFHSKKCRAVQMNCGVQQAKGDILLFLHADTIIALNSLKVIEQKLNQDGFIGGCLTQRIDNDSPIYRFIEALGNSRARARKIFYGDQGIFVKKDVFLKIGGFPEVPILEDILFTKRMRKIGQTVILSDRIMVSARRWEKNGVIKTTLLFNLIILLFCLKVPLNKIQQFYEDIR